MIAPSLAALLPLLTVLACGGSGSVVLDSGLTTHTGTGTPTTTGTTSTSTTGTGTGTTSTSSTTGTTTRTFGEGQVLVVPNWGEVALFDAAGAEQGRWRFNDLTGTSDCSNQCDAEGGSADGDGLLLTWAESTPQRDGGVLRLMPQGGELVADWWFAGLRFPHDAARDPNGKGIVVVETFEDRVAWYEQDGSRVLHELDRSHPDWNDYAAPNGMQILAHEGRDYLVLTNRGGGRDANGRVSLWDITDVEDMKRVWEFPTAGALADSHGGELRRQGEQWVLVYAHSSGLGNASSVGFATTDDLLTVPTYLVDLVPPASAPALEWAKFAELTDAGTLFITDAGANEGAVAGTIYQSTLPSGLAPAGKSGAFTEGGGEQELMELTVWKTFVDEGVTHPFEAWVWDDPFQ